jgi:hypothetical protein
MGATSYSWIVPAGVTITGGNGTSSITISKSPSFVTGVITVRGVNICGSVPGPTKTIYGNVPIAPNSIVGPTNVCGLTSANYTTTTATGSTGFLWTVPTGFHINTGQGSSSINVTISGFVSGMISVAGTNSCGAGLNRNLALSTSATAPTTISGATATCGLTSAVYSVAPVAGAVSYFWTVPSGMSITNGQYTSSISTSFITAPTGTISVTSNNGCANSSAKTLYISKTTPAPGTITGPTLICGLTTANYTISPVTGAISYNWYLPAGMTLMSGQGTTKIVVNAPLSISAGTLKVNAQNSCGNSLASTLAIVACANPEFIDETQLSDNFFFTLHPNPASDEFSVDMYSVSDSHFIIEIYDVLGKLITQEEHFIETGKTNTFKTDIGNYLGGMYFVRIVNKDNGNVYSRKLIKQ